MLRPVLQTERLILREPMLADADDVFHFRSDPEVQRYNSAPHATRADSLALIETLRAGDDVVWASCLAQGGRVIGLVGFAGFDLYHRRVEVGFDLAQEFWGQGLAGEALDAVLTYGFASMDLNRVEALTIADNHASVRLLERSGFVREGTRRAYSWETDGTFHDSAIYGLLGSEWSAVKTRQDPTRPGRR